MKINRVALTQHVEKIACGGEINSAVFTGAFETLALSPDQLLFVRAPSMDGCRGKLKGELGVPYLSELQLGVNGRSDDTVKDIEVERNAQHLVFKAQRGANHVLIVDASTIPTHVPDKILKVLEERTPSRANPIDLPDQLRADICDAFKDWGADALELFFGPTGGSIHVGVSTASQTRLPAEALMADEEGSMLFKHHFVDVLKVLPKDAEAQMHLAPDFSNVLITAGDYEYLLSRVTRGKDE